MKNSESCFFFSSFNIHHSIFTIRYSSFFIHDSPFIIQFFDMAHTQEKNKKTFTDTKPVESITIDARGKKLGRLASEIAHLLMGKQYPSFRRHILKEVKVTVVDAGKLDVSPKKKSTKRYALYSGYPGGLRHESAEEVVRKKGASELVRRAVYGMLPANKLRTPRMKNLVIKE